MPGKRISVVLSTRNRGVLVGEAARTILENDHPDFELIIVDQSEDESTRTALDTFLNDARLRYIRSDTRGRSAGQNIAARTARGDLLALTDDDCTVAPDWLRSIEAAFSVNPRVGVVFGNVIPAAHDPRAGCIPAYIRKSAFLARNVGDKFRVEGMGACMAVRRDIWESLGGLDEMLGSGAPFRAGEDGDLAVRALRAGYWIYETPEVEVRHHGFRRWSDVPDLIESYWYGTGAMFAKAVKTCGWPIFLLLARLGMRWVFGQSPVAASLGGRPERLRKLRAFCRGFAAGAGAAVSRQTGLYVRHTPEYQESAGCVR